MQTVMPDTPYSNPMAPQWMYPDWGQLDWVETQFTYTFPFTVPAAGLSNQKLAFGFDSWFIVTDWKILGFDQIAVNSSIEVRLTDDNGQRRINAFVPSYQAGAYIPKSWEIQPGGNQFIDFRNTSGGDITLYVVFNGRKRFQRLAGSGLPPGYVPVDYCPLWERYSAAPPGWVDEPFIYSFTLWSVTAPYAARIEGIPLQIDTDAPFFVRTICLDHNVIAESSTAFSARLSDAYGNRLVLNSNPGSLTNPYALGVNFGGFLPVSTAGRNVYPELACPAGSVLTVDINLTISSGVTDGILRLQGVKRFRAGER